MSTSEKLVALFLIASLVLLFLALLLFRSTRTSPEQRFHFVAAVFVQLMGTVAFGAVVSYSLFTIQHTQELLDKERADLDLAAANKRRVVNYIKAELTYDLDAIKAKRGPGTVLDLAIHQTPLKSDFWKIAGLSGDLKWIDDIAILNLVSEAYFNIDNVHGWETRFLDATFGTGLVMTVNVGGQSMPMRDYVVNFVRQTYPPAISAIEATLASSSGAPDCRWSIAGPRAPCYYLLQLPYGENQLRPHRHGKGAHRQRALKELWRNFSRRRHRRQHRRGI